MNCTPEPRIARRIARQMDHRLTNCVTRCLKLRSRGIYLRYISRCVSIIDSNNLFFFSVSATYTLLYILGGHSKRHRPARDIGVRAAGGRSRREKREFILRILRGDKQASLEDRRPREASVRRGLRRGQRLRVRSSGRIVDRLDSGWQQIHHRLHVDDRAARRRSQSRRTGVSDQGAHLHRGSTVSEHPARVYRESSQRPGSDLRPWQSSENECMMMRCSLVRSMDEKKKDLYNDLFFRKH